MRRAAERGKVSAKQKDLAARLKSDIRALMTRPDSANPQHLIIDGGISLRDYFAAQALPQLLVASRINADYCFDSAKALATRRGEDPPVLKRMDQVIAYLCFGMADAMLAEREK